MLDKLFQYINQTTPVVGHSAVPDSRSKDAHTFAPRDVFDAREASSNEYVRRYLDSLGVPEL